LTYIFLNNFDLGLSLEDMNDLFEQSNAMHKFTPSRLADVPRTRELKADDCPFAEQVEDIKA